MDTLYHRNAIVTGASRGIGVYIARALAREGMNIALVARSLPPIEQLANQLCNAGVRAIAIRADVAEAASRSMLLQRAAAELGPIDVLVNNAAVESNEAFAEFSPSVIEQTVHVDLIAPMLLTREILPAMLSRKQGHVINIASLAGKSPTAFNVPYSARRSSVAA